MNSPIERETYNIGEAPKYWLFDAAYIHTVWDFCAKMGCIVMPWDLLKNYARYKSKTSLEKNLKRVYGRPEKNYYEESLAIWNFLHVMKQGDVILVKDGDDRIITRGTVISDCFYTTDRSYRNRRKVRWDSWRHLDINLPKEESVLFDLTPFPDLIAKFRENSSTSSAVEFSGRWLVLIDPTVSNLSDYVAGNKLFLPLYRESAGKDIFSKYWKHVGPGDGLIVLNYVERKIVCEAECIDKAGDDPIVHVVISKVIDVDMNDLSYFDNDKQPYLRFLNNSDELCMPISEESYGILINDLEQRWRKVKKISYTRADFLEEVFMTEAQADRLAQLLRRKKNIILQGAPGVGKTFSAKRLAYLMMGERDEGRIEMVQFHQSYNYEDFIMGYKPTENGGFTLSPGIFYEFCRRASADASKDYYFIIDEINRGNLSKIFGELFQLIEADYRGKEIRLAYKKDELFSVPENLYIIGMMNTADRSLAMMDYALRRRFSFFYMEPGFDTDGFRNYSRSLGRSCHSSLVEAVKKVNEIIMRDDSLGRGFMIGHSYLIPKLEDNNGNRLVFNRELAKSIIEFDIIPLVEEYWFDDNEKISKAKEILRKALER